MRLTIEILGEALAMLYDGLGEETVTADDHIAVTRAAFVRTSHRVAHDVANGLIHANAREYIEAQLQRRLEQFSATFAENVREQRQDEIREEFVREYARPLHAYLENRMTDYSATLGHQIVYVYRELESGRMRVDWSHEAVAFFIASIVGLFTLAFYGLVLLPINLTFDMALSIDVGVLTVLLTAFGLNGNLRMTLPLNQRIDVVSRNPFFQKPTTVYLNLPRVRFPQRQDISEESEQRKMTDDVDLSSDLLAVSPAEFFNSVFRTNSLAQMFRQEGSHPRMPDEISHLIFRFMLPPHIFAAMVQLVPDGRLSFQLHAPDTDQPEKEDADDSDEEKDGKKKGGGPGGD